MRILKLALAAALAVGTFSLPAAPAEAQRHSHSRGHHHHARGHHHHARGHARRVCRTVWRHGHRHRVCGVARRHRH